MGSAISKVKRDSAMRSRVVVTDAEGCARTYRAGDAFVTPKGFSGTWEVIEPIKKHFTWYGSSE